MTIADKSRLVKRLVKGTPLTFAEGDVNTSELFNVITDVENLTIKQNNDYIELRSDLDDVDNGVAEHEAKQNPHPFYTSANNINYNNLSSGLSATRVQTAIDEINTKIGVSGSHTTLSNRNAPNSHPASAIEFNGSTVELKLNSIDEEKADKSELTTLENNINIQLSNKLDKPIVTGDIENEVVTFDQYGDAQPSGFIIDDSLDTDSNLWSAKAILTKTKSDNYEPTMPYDTGTSTSGTTNSLTDTTKTWNINEFVDKVVFIQDVGYYIIESNTIDTLTFDDNDIVPIEAGAEYTILDAIVLDKNLYPVVVAINLEDHDCAVILPDVDANIERKPVHIYVEKSLNGNHQCAVIARGANRFLNRKWTTLDHRYEGVQLLAHTYLMNHWDIVNSYNIKRFAVGKFDVDVDVDSTDYIEINQNVVDLKNKRFELVDVSGQKVFCYRSAIPTDFEINANLNITKTGAHAGELTATIRVKHLDETFDDYTDFEATTRFGGGEGKSTLNFSVPVELRFRDKIYIMAKRTSQTFIVESGSTLFINEL